jgi:hypothetical protein
MTSVNEHKLVGLEPDNLLAFLALLGLLRALERARPAWRPRVRWDVENPPTRPVLVLASEQSRESVSEAAAAGCDALADDYQFGDWKVPNRSRQEARELLASSVGSDPKDRGRSDVLAAIMSDIAVRETDGTVLPTPLCLLFGQGHQYFLERLSQVPREASAPPRGKGKKAVTPTPADRTDPSPSFRWDPEEDRRYALRFSDPSKDTALTVHGANRLAAIGMPVFTVAPSSVRNRIRLVALGSRQTKGNTEISWPIWTKPASLHAIRALVSHPVFQEDTPDPARVRALGVHEVRRTRRISVGKYLNFTRAVAV